MNHLIFACLVVCTSFSTYATTESRGPGGGGALSGISFDPYIANHLFMGTDMGLVYESFDLGKHWKAIDHNKIGFNVDLTHQTHMGFDKNGNLYWAEGGCDPKISKDHGQTWLPMSTLKAMLPEECLQAETRIKYWVFSEDNEQFIAVGSSQGLFLSQDQGKTWTHLFENQDSLNSLVSDKHTLTHASSTGIVKLDTNSLLTTTLLAAPLGSAAMGQDEKGLTLVGVEKKEGTPKKIYIKKASDNTFTQELKNIGKYIAMSAKNSTIIYYTGDISQDDASSIWVSEDTGTHWSKRFVSDQYAYDHGQINPNAIGLYVGFWDNEYFDFQVSSNNPTISASGGNFFFKISSDSANHWSFPYSEINNPKTPITRESFWKSSELNPISIYFIKRNPLKKDMLVAGVADIGCILSQDNGLSWRMCNIPDMNSTYDIVFDPNNADTLYAAASTIHDFPQDWHADILIHDVPGGVFISKDAGTHWQRLTPNDASFNIPFLSLAIDFKQAPCHIYGGTHGKGIATSNDCGSHWQYLNNGFESQESSTNSEDKKGSLIFPSLKISPKTGEVYALHAGNRLWEPDPNNQFIQYSGLYKLNKEKQNWQQLGRPAQSMAPGDGGLYWKYPIDFAVDWDKPQNIYLIDMATPGTWKIAGLWYTMNEGQSWQEILQFDYPHRIIMHNDAIYIVGWNNEDGAFIYKSSKDNHFEAVDIPLPLKRVNDALIDDDGFWFATFGGGIFKVTP